MGVPSPSARPWSGSLGRERWICCPVSPCPFSRWLAYVLLLLLELLVCLFTLLGLAKQSKWLVIV